MFISHDFFDKSSVFCLILLVFVPFNSFLRGMRISDFEPVTEFPLVCCFFGLWLSFFRVFCFLLF